MAMQTVKVGIVAALAMGFGGCGELPIVSDAKTVGHESLFAQQDWVLAQTDEALDTLGAAEGWYAYFPELQWPRDKERIVEGADTSICGSGRINQRPGQLVLTVSNKNFGDPAEAAQRLWDHWEAEGWDVSYVIDPADQREGEIDFRADREDGAMLAFGGNSIYVEVEVVSSCSDDDSVMKRY